MNSIEIPIDVFEILEVLNKHEFEAFVVGGCVRDSILGKTPKDWDITTNASPESVKRMFEKTVDTGIKHGTVTVVINSTNYEVTTFRIDGKYTDNRRPEDIKFTSSLKKDLNRRDFTMNAIAYHPEIGFVDPFGGKNDINNCIIRAVGSPSRRFQEDALRMLRAIRFSAQLNFMIDENTLKAIKSNGHLIKNISQERIREELSKILLSCFPDKFRLLKTTNLLKYIIPEFEPCFNTVQNNPYHISDVATHSLNSVSEIKSDLALRWAMLLHDIGKPYVKTTDTDGIDHFYKHPYKSKDLAEIILERLKFDKKTIHKVCMLVEYHDKDIAPTGKSVRKNVNIVGEDIFLDLLLVKEADAKAQNPAFLNKKLSIVNRIRNLYIDIKEKHQCISLKDLAVNGDDLINLGYNPGKEIGLLLNRLLELVIEKPELNTKDSLLDTVEKIK